MPNPRPHPLCPSPSPSSSIWPQNHQKTQRRNSTGPSPNGNNGPLDLNENADGIFAQNEASVRCFCDKQTCGGGALVCAGKFCLIGVRTDESGQSRLDQHCVDEHIMPAGKQCARDWKRWSEVCICEEGLCNTFAFLRGQMDANPHDQNPQNQHFLMDSPGGPLLYNHPAHQDEDDEEDEGNGGSIGGGGGNVRERDARRLHHQHGLHPGSRGGAPLVLLLVVLPLVVGAFTVFLVFLNYHCKML